MLVLWRAAARQQTDAVGFSIGAVAGGLLPPSDVVRIDSSFARDARAPALAGALAAQEAFALRRRLYLPRGRDAHRELLQRAMAMLEAALSPERRGSNGETANEPDGQDRCKLGEASCGEQASDEQPSDEQPSGEQASGEQPSDEEASGEQPSQPPASWRLTCRELLFDVYSAFVEDARHGVGQLSRSAQRAPTEVDCEDGWRRVETIARGADAVARRAAALRRDDDPPRVHTLVERIERVARAARAIVTERNHAYTFHANPAFSFGEGWYAAAAGVLGGVCLQIEPDQKHSAAVLKFLEGAGLASQLRAYYPRPRANKALPLVVADAFRRDAASAQARLRAALLGDSEVVPRVHAWLEARLGSPPNRLTVLVWNRQCRHHAHRNSSPEELATLCRLAVEAELQPISIGDGSVQLPEQALDLTLFWKEPLFQGLEMRRAQLEVFECLRERYGLVGQVGVTTAGMDGPALLGLPTLYLTAEPNVRLGRWVGAVPGYEEVVRDGTHLTHIATRLRAWARAHTTRCGTSEEIDDSTRASRNT